MANESSAPIEMPSTCPHCKQKQVVHIRDGINFNQSSPQSIRCVQCDKTFAEIFPGELVGGPFRR